MGGLVEPSPLGAQQSESNMRPILLGVALVVVVVTVIVLLNRATPKGPTAPWLAPTIRIDGLTVGGE